MQHNAVLLLTKLHIVHSFIPVFQEQLCIMMNDNSGNTANLKSVNKNRLVNTQLIHKISSFI